MSASIFSEFTRFAIQAALDAGQLLKEGFGTAFSIATKEGRHNLVTDFDYRSEKQIISFLEKKTPGFRFLAEESGSSGLKGDGLWIIDPLDGTVNFAHNIPFFSISIALEKEGELVSGVVYHPLLEELFVAEKGKGAYLNQKPIRVSGTQLLHHAILATGFPYNLAENPHHCIEHFTDILKLGLPIRRLGSAALDLAYTACGRFDGFFEVSLSPWDCAAGILLLEEAGGKISEWDEKPFLIHSKAPILATNHAIHHALSLILTRRVQ